jgi:hypothetical protein
MRGLAERGPRGYPCGGPAEALPVFGQGLIGGLITGVTGSRTALTLRGPRERCTFRGHDLND